MKGFFKYLFSLKPKINLFEQCGQVTSILPLLIGILQNLEHIGHLILIRIGFIIN
jgi:hypothetical protein